MEGNNIMTWGEIESTPINLNQSEDKHFRIQKESKRDMIKQEIYQKYKNKKRAE